MLRFAPIERGDHLYFAASEVGLPSGGGTAITAPGVFSTQQSRPLTNGNRPFVTDEANLYWLGATNPASGSPTGGLLTISLTSGDVTGVVPSQCCSHHCSLTMDDSSLYWTNDCTAFLDGTNPPQVARMDKKSGQVVVLDQTVSAPTDLVVAGQYVYFATERDGVWRVSTEGTGLQRLVDLQGPLALDETSLYGFSIDGRLMKVSLDGSNITQLLATAGPSTGIAVDDTGIYVVTGHPSLIRLSPK